MTSEQLGAATGKTPGEVTRDRLRAFRKSRKLNPSRAAELYADPSMTATVLMNIEAGRRQTATTVDELIRLAYVLDVPPEALLVAPDTLVQVAPDVVVDSSAFLRWLRGQEPLAGTDADRYREAAGEAFGDTQQTVSDELRNEFLSRAQAAFDGFFADSEQIRLKTREQVRDVLGEVRDAVASGRSADEITDMIDSYLDRLQ